MPRYRKTATISAEMSQVDRMPFVADGALYDLMFTPQVYDVLHSVWVPFVIGDYIIKGTAGEFYPCKRDVFEAMYEEVGE